MISRIKPNGWFWICCLILFFVMDYPSVLDKPPQSMHQGAQADRASVAYTFYTDGMDFFHPRVLETRANDGICGMEFPVINYSAAILYKIFGVHDYLYRGLMLLICFLGMFAAFRISGFFIQKTLHRLVLVFGCFVSPLFIFYSANYVPDPAALSLSLWAWYYFFRFYFGIRPKNAIWKFILFITIAGLIKVTFLLPIFIIIGIWILQRTRIIALNPGIPLEVPTAALLLLPLLPVTAWYYYAGRLTEQMRNPHFLQSIKPAKNIPDFIENTRYAFNTWQESIYLPNMLYGVLLAGLLLFIFRRSQAPLIAWLFLFNLLGFVAIFVLFNFQFRYHDYYFISLFPTLFFAFIFFQQIFIENRRFFLGVVPIAALLLFYLLPVKNVFHAMDIQKEKYKEGSYYNQTPLEGTRFFISEADSINSYIPPGQRIFVAFDPQPDISLYLLKRKGVRIEKDYPPDVARMILYDAGVHYLVINDLPHFDEFFEPTLKTNKKLLYKKGIISLWKM